jgi:NADH:ubiquinone oxidoreductase subunit F (NADH-binding)
MTLISHPGSYQQMTTIAMDAGIARDTALMLADVHALLEGLAACGEAAAASQAILGDADSPYTLRGLAGAVSETVSRLHQAIGDALAGVPGTIPGL